MRRATYAATPVASSLLYVPAMHRETAKPSGQTIGRYHLHRQIARGGMARIHIARSLGAEGFTRLVAAKRLDPALANDPEFVAMFLDEARVASKVHHRNVVPVIDVVTIDGELIMVQELVHGAPLHKLFSRAQQAGVRIPINIAVSIAMQTLAGLHAAHEAVDETGTPLNIVHRDVSPQNIMIASDGTARLLDFGVAKTAAAAHVTQNGTFKGKLAYSSPEQLRGNACRQSDIYALAIVLWELLTCDRLHSARSEAEIFTSIVEGKPPALTGALAKHRAAGTIDDATWCQLAALEPVLAKAFAHDLAERYATAIEMEHALLAVVEPAPLVDVAAWLRSLAQDMLDETDQVIAAEEASWRKALGSGVMPTYKPTSSESRRASTSMPTQAAIPSARLRCSANGSQPLAAIGTSPRRRLETEAESPIARARSVAANRSQTLAVILTQPSRRVTPLAFALAGGVAVLLIVMLLLTRSWSHDAIAATLPPPLPLVAAPMSPAPIGATSLSKREAAVAKPHAPATPVKRRPALRRAAKNKTDCSTPFYYEGKKKLFKPRCI